MKLSNILLGHEDRTVDHTFDYLKANGFSDIEAVHLHQLQTWRRRGLYAGLLGGAIACYSNYKSQRFLIPVIPKRFLKLSYPLSIVAGVLLGYYFFNGNRSGANTVFTNLYTNNVLVTNKMLLVSQFHPFNRKFTEEEKEQMLFNARLKRWGRKKYIYNPLVHGPDEAKFKEKHERFNSGYFTVPLELEARIYAENVEKLKSGEKVRLLPFKLIDHLSVDGSEIGMKKLGLFKKKEAV